MPELPEVEVLRRQIESVLPAGSELTGFEFLRADIRDPIPKNKLKALLGQKLVRIERRSKYLLFIFEKGAVISHLGMTGSWRRLASGEKPLKTSHDHVVMRFKGHLAFVFRDARRFGILDYGDLERLNTHPRFRALGPEPFGAEFQFEAFYKRLKTSKVPVKTMLMNPKLVVGVGNIYASELLFRVGIKPTRPSSRLTRIEALAIFEKIPVLLKEAIEAGGSSIRDYQSLAGEKGSFQSGHLVYGREDQSCSVCGTIIRSQFLAGRSTFWCPKCQK